MVRTVSNIKLLISIGKTVQGASFKITSVLIRVVYRYLPFRAKPYYYL